VIELDIDDIPVNTEPEEQKSSKRKGTASGTTASGKKALTVPQLRALSGKSPMAVEESKKLEDSIDQNGTPDNQPAVDIVEETDAAAATIASPSDSSSTVVGLVTVNTADNGGEDTTEGRGSVDTTMNAERHNAQSSAVTVVGGNESPAVSMNNSATSTRRPTIHDRGHYGCESTTWHSWELWGSTNRITIVSPVVPLS